MKKIIILSMLFFAAIGANAQPVSLDSTFGTNGVVISDFGNSNNYAYSVAIQTDGKIVVAGSSDSHFAVVRYNTNGTLDATFGTNGAVISDFGNSNNYAHSVAIQTDGKIVVAGLSINGSLLINENTDLIVVRYNDNGELDNNFGTGGTIITPVGVSSYYNRVAAVSIQTDGKIVVASCLNDTYILIRYNIDGTLDNAFGTNGEVVGSSTDRVNSIIIQTDGKIVIAGSSDSHSALFRYNINGTLDNTFGTNGKVTTTFESATANCVTIQMDGKIVVAGRLFIAEGGYDYGPDYDIAIVRYNTDGDIDTTFGTNGKVITHIDQFDDNANAVSIQTDGKIIIAGYASFFEDYSSILVRYNTDGTIDSTFGGYGRIYPKGTMAYSLVIQTDGKIVVAGFLEYDSNIDIVVVRYNGDVGSVVIRKLHLDNDIAIYPNPATDNITISSKSNVQQNYTFEIKNIQGQELLNKKINITGTYTVDVSSLSNGVYILTLGNERENIVKRIVKSE